MGGGNVGSQLLRDIHQYDSLGNGHTNPTELVAVLNNTSDGLRLICRGDIHRLLQMPSKDDFLRFGIPIQDQQHLLEIMRRTGHSGSLVFVDASTDPTDWMLHMQLAALEAGEGVATANKKILVDSDYETQFRRMVRRPQKYQYGPTVMAGSPLITCLQDAVNIHDRVPGIEAALSGTFAFICSELEKGRIFSEIVLEAMGKGYAESNPFIDL